MADFTKTVKALAALGLGVTSYIIFLTRNYDLYWTYYIFVLSILVLSIPRTKRREVNEKTPLKERFNIQTIVFLISLTVSFCLLLLNYLNYHSCVTLEKGVYQFQTVEEEPKYYIQDSKTTFKSAYTSIPRKPMNPKFQQGLLNDLSRIEGENISFVRALNWDRMKWKEGKPIKIFLTPSAISPTGTSAVIIHLYPNGMAFVVMGTPDSKFRAFKLELQESLPYLMEIYKEQ